IGHLPPGTYDVTFYYAETTSHRGGVRVQANQAAPVYHTLDTSRTAGEVVSIEGRAPTVDASSTSIAQESTRNIPVPGRSFVTAAGSAAGSQADRAGPPPTPAPPPNPYASGDQKLAALVPDLVKQR